MEYKGPEKRKHPRITARFVVSYRILEESDVVDISQTKNLSLGGMLLTTNRKFDSGVRLALEIKIPFDTTPIEIIGRIIESKEVIKELIYDTRLEFLKIDEKHLKSITETLDYYLKKG